MWLLDATTLELHAFFVDIPEYVILSHTWGAEEVTFDDIGKPHARHMAGYSKIAGCCRLALRDGFKFAWIDTCCIDKRSSAELSEAINSMYSWYWRSAICYAYLPDVFTGDSWQYEMRSSRWFTRGWTLQELIAPEIVEFYNEAWEWLGTKARLIDIVEDVTKISPRVLLDRTIIRQSTIASRLSWAALRKTTRVEDMAYCLLGIMGVNMPMLYGEGDRAFYRLQLEIMRQSNEHSIFAWQAPSQEYTTSSVLASSPAWFEGSSSVQLTRLGKSAEAKTHEVTNNGLRIALPCIKIGQDRVIGLLNCLNTQAQVLGIWLEHIDDERWQRLPGSKLATLSTEEVDDTETVVMYLVINNETNHEGNLNGRQCRMAVDRILTDSHCIVTGLTVTTGYSTGLGKNALPPGHSTTGLEANPTRFLLDKLVLQEGEIAYVEVDHCPTFGTSSTLTAHSHAIIFGLLGGRAVTHVPKGTTAEMTNTFGTWSEWDWKKNWATELQTSSLQRSASDFGTIRKLRTPGVFQTHTVIELEAKKQQRAGVIHWSVTICIYDCKCGRFRGASTICTCDMRYLTEAHTTSRQLL